MSDKESQELIQYRYNKAVETIGQIEMLWDNKMWNVAVSRLYYACYYAVSALLSSINIYPKTHSGAAQMFGLHFIKTGVVKKDTADLYKILFDMRQGTDYEDFVDYGEKDVTPLIQPVKDMIASIGELMYPANK